MNKVVQTRSGRHVSRLLRRTQRLRANNWVSCDKVWNYAIGLTFLRERLLPGATLVGKSLCAASRASYFGSQSLLGSVASDAGAERMTTSIGLPSSAVPNRLEMTWRAELASVGLFEQHVGRSWRASASLAIQRVRFLQRQDSVWSGLCQ